jgi:mannan endo-1,4-beta-mannosidase
MRSRLVLLAAIVIGAIAVTFAVVHAASRPASSQPPAAIASLSPRPASYLGVYENGAPPAYRPVAGFAQAAGRQPDLVGYFSGWAQPFATAFAKQVRGRGGVIMVQIDPAFASVAGIAAGAYDSYLRSYADSVRAFGHPVVIGFGHEMNARWYSWGYTHVPARTFVEAWRHVVTVFRDQGARNVTWLWTVNAEISSTGPVAAWWPGSQYVTWVGIDGYFYRPADTFASVFGATLHQVRAFGKPVLLSETAVGPHAGQAAKISDLFAGMARYKTLGLVWFDNAQNNGIYHQDWRIEDSPAAQKAFRLGAQGELAPPGPR